MSAFDPKRASLQAGTPTYCNVTYSLSGPTGPIMNDEPALCALCNSGTVPISKNRRSVVGAA